MINFSILGLSAKNFRLRIAIWPLSQIQNELNALKFLRKFKSGFSAFPHNASGSSQIFQAIPQHSFRLSNQHSCEASNDLFVEGHQRLLARQPTMLLQRRKKIEIFQNLFTRKLRARMQIKLHLRKLQLHEIFDATKQLNERLRSHKSSMRF